MSTLREAQYPLIDADNIVWNGMFATRAFLNDVVVWAKVEARISVDKVNVVLSKSNGYTDQIAINATKPFTIYQLDY